MSSGWIISPSLSTEAILKIYNTLVLPTFLYGSENWTLTALRRRRIEVAEMKLLRPLAGYTIYDRKTNDSVHRELHTEYILDKIDEYRRNWLLHLQRMLPNRIHLKSYLYSPQGRRTIGRPKKRWREQLQLLWRRNGSKGPILDVYDDDEYDDDAGYTKIEGQSMRMHYRSNSNSTCAANCLISFL